METNGITPSLNILVGKGTISCMVKGEVKEIVTRKVMFELCHFINLP